MPDVTMPRLSDSMEEGTILKWLKSEGDDVSKGDELVEIETDKATMTYEADTDGTLEIIADEGATLAIGEVIARIGEGGGGSSEAGGGSGKGGRGGGGGREGGGGGGRGRLVRGRRDCDEARRGGRRRAGGRGRRGRVRR